MTTDLIPDGPKALRDFADQMEAEARQYDRPQYGRERSTVAETFRHAASLARQKAARLERFIATATKAKGASR